MHIYVGKHNEICELFDIFSNYANMTEVDSCHYSTFGYVNTLTKDTLSNMFHSTIFFEI